MQGDALCGLGRHGDAIDSYERALALDPGNVDALNREGLAFQALFRYRDALTCHNRVLEIDPRSTAARTHRDLVLDKLSPV